MYSRKEDILGLVGLILILAGVFIVLWQAFGAWFGLAGVLLLLGALLIFAAIGLSQSGDLQPRPEPNTYPPTERVR